MPVPAMTDQPCARCTKHGTLGTDVILWRWWWCWQWACCCSMLCFTLGDQVGCAVALKVGCAFVADLTPSRPGSQPWSPCSWVVVACLQCLFDGVLVPVALATPESTTLFQLSKEESLVNMVISYTPHMAGPSKLICHDVGLCLCDVAAVENLVWNLVFPCDSTNHLEAACVELFRLLEVRVLLYVVHISDP